MNRLLFFLNDDRISRTSCASDARQRRWCADLLAAFILKTDLRVYPFAQAKGCRARAYIQESSPVRHGSLSKEPMCQEADDRGIGGRVDGRLPTGGLDPGAWTNPCRAFAFASHHGETAWFAKPVSLLPTFEKVIK